MPAADDAHLYLWVTNSFLREGFEVLDAWGFEYRTMLTWAKPQMGTGNYFRGATEHVMFATRGNLPIPPERREVNWFQAPRGRHSEKPDCFHELVERVSLVLAWRCSPGTVERGGRSGGWKRKDSSTSCSSGTTLFRIGRELCHRGSRGIG